MGESPSHKFGQQIGDLLEAAISVELAKFAALHGLYLDKKGPRAARSGQKVSWTDSFGNTHDLDFVLEKGGSDTVIGAPIAFIEVAWRRYTKHSRNKAQEIQGAIQPLFITNQDSCPFIGAILAGVFTHESLKQLESIGFKVLYIDYTSIVASFTQFGIDAQFDEDTTDAEFRKKTLAVDALTETQKKGIERKLIDLNREKTDNFILSLDRTVNRQIAQIIILPLYGEETSLRSIIDAIGFLERYKEANSSGIVKKYEIDVRYNNGDNVRGQFKDKTSAISFLKKYQTPTFSPAGVRDRSTST